MRSANIFKPFFRPSGYAQRGSLLDRVLRNPVVCACLALIAVLVLIAAFAPLLSHYDPTKIDLESSLRPPCADHPLGTDHMGRDILCRILFGTRTSLLVAFSVVGMALLIGVSMGSLAGYYGGLVDDIIARVLDIFLSFPGMIFALAIVGALGGSILNLILALGLVHWAGYARVMRGQVLSVKNSEYVSSARVIGAGDIRIMARHILPNAVAPVAVLATLDIGHVILSAAALSFLGLGIPPSIPEWGSMLNAGKEFMRTAPYLTIFPGLAITFTVVLFSLLGEGLRDVLDPDNQEGSGVESH